MLVVQHEFDPSIRPAASQPAAEDRRRKEGFWGLGKLGSIGECREHTPTRTSSGKEEIMTKAQDRMVGD